MSTYPSALLAKADVVDEIDVVSASDYNTTKNEVIAMQTYIGTNPHGSRNNLTDRLATLMATNGAIANSNGFPTGTLYDGQMFYRTDQNTLYIYNGTSWDSQGQSLSNVLFQYSAACYSSGLEVNAASLNSTGPRTFRFLQGILGGATATVWIGQFKKISGISSVTCKADIWNAPTASGGLAKIFVDIGGSIATAFGASDRTSPETITVGPISLSGLGDGTFYSVTVSLADSNLRADNYVRLGNLIGFGS